MQQRYLVLFKIGSTRSDDVLPGSFGLARQIAPLDVLCLSVRFFHLYRIEAPHLVSLLQSTDSLDNRFVLLARSRPLKPIAQRPQLLFKPLPPTRQYRLVLGLSFRALT